MRNTKNHCLGYYDGRVYLWIHDRPASYTDNDEIMGPILEMPIWTWHWKADGRLGAVVSTEGKRAGITGEPYLYQLRWAAEYYEARADCKSIAEALRAMKGDFSIGSYEIDHLDNNFKNCCIWNLGKMTHKENASKYDLTAKIYDPFFWFSVNMGQSYRILCGSEAGRPIRISCSTSEEYIAILRQFYTDESLFICPPKEILEPNRIGYDHNGNLDDSTERIVQYLLNAPESDFFQWKGKLGRTIVKLGGAR